MRTLFGALVVTAVALSGCADHDGHSTASDTEDRTADRVVEITMVDNAFQPVELTARKGETITFRFTNDGKVRHEALVGDAAAQDEHATQMTGSTMAGDHDMGDMGDMDGMHHDGADTAVTVDPGESKDITTTFDDAGTVIIGCHQPGHYEAGMKATVTVT